MSRLRRLTDRFVLQPSTDFIDPEHRIRQTIETEFGLVEAWVTWSRDRDENAASTPQRIGITFPGTGGRAERGGSHPFELFPDILTEVWTINHAGYGGSAGPASLKKFAPTCDAIWLHLKNLYPELPFFVVGNSLGCLSALYLAAHYEPTGLYLRNPVPLRQMIATRLKYNWWSFGFAKIIARQVPAELGAIENASRCACPALFVRSGRDRVTPGKYQRQIFEAYAGEKSEFVIHGADHHHPIPESQTTDYVKFVQRNMAS